jgi:hypothetical protein
LERGGDALIEPERLRAGQRRGWRRSRCIVSKCLFFSIGNDQSRNDEAPRNTTRRTHSILFRFVGNPRRSRTMNPE